MKQEPDILVRDSRADDVPAITAIYNHWVLTGLASFEIEPPDAAEIDRRRDGVLAGRYPYLVAADRKRGVILGYAYANAYRLRPAYRFACENSIYVGPEASGRGIGRLLLGSFDNAV